MDPTSLEAPDSRFPPVDLSPDDGVRWTDDEDGRGPRWPHGKALRCTATSKQRKRRCRRPVTPGSNVCRTHGARAGGPFKHGRHSVKAGRLAAAREAALKDPKALVSPWEGLATMRAACDRVMQIVEDHDSPEFRERALERYQEAASGGEGAALALAQLGDLLERGAQETRALATLVETVSKLQKHIEESWKIELTREKVLPIRDAIGFTTTMVDIVLQEADSETAERVMARIDALFRGMGVAIPEKTKKPRVIEAKGEE